MKLYIILKDTCPNDIAPLMSAHAVMAAYNKFEKDPLMQAWRTSPKFKKVVCRASLAVFEAAKQQGEYVALTESNHRDLGEIALAFNIQKDYPKFFKFLSMWKVKED